jgi:hypothetical protein
MSLYSNFSSMTSQSYFGKGKAVFELPSYSQTFMLEVLGNPGADRGPGTGTFCLCVHAGLLCVRGSRGRRVLYTS